MHDRWWRWGPAAAVVCFAAAAVSALVGYLRLSLEPSVARQIPYLASAGMAVIVLSAAGTALLVASRAAARTAELGELAEAVEHLAAALAATVERPARRSAAPNPAAAAPDDPDPGEPSDQRNS